MTTTVNKDLGEGGADLDESNGERATVAKALQDGATDLETMRVQFNALLAKLDTDAGVTSTDYASTLGVAADDILLKKGV